VLLQRSYRFAPDSGIGQFARAVNAGDATAARQMLDGATRGEFGDLTALDLSQAGDWRDRLAQPYEEMLRRFADPELGPQHKLDILDEYRVLCALREGSAGVNRINNAIESHLAHCGLVIPGQVNYAGRPIMVVENNYALQLYNGDNGVILHDATGQLAAFFTTVDGHVRQIAIGRLPRYECSYAISVHKSQGSEYRHVALVLPSADGGEMNPLITRELIYTAVTRAREELTLACNVDVMCAGLRRRVQRQSGLAARLREVG
jgi:exodeoxyribonuclease V alpha subunit